MSFTPSEKMSAYEREVAEVPDYYTAIAFRGRAVYDREERPTLEAAFEAAAALYQDRPIALYAVRGGDTAMIGIWRP